MIKQEAIKVDTSKYVDFDNKTCCWSVYGNNSGFRYASFAVESQAWNYIKNKVLHEADQM